jgi:hypothetical protein
MLRGRADGTYSYTWDATNRLLAIRLAGRGAEVASYSYDADGMRATTKVSGTTTRSVVDERSDEMVAVTDAAGVELTRFR